MRRCLAKLFLIMHVTGKKGDYNEKANVRSGRGNVDGSSF